MRGPAAQGLQPLPTSDMRLWLARQSQQPANIVPLDLPQAVVHSWLSFKGHSLGSCRLAEAWVAATAAGFNRGGADMQGNNSGAADGGARPAMARAPCLVSKCQQADITGLKASELLQHVTWAAACRRGGKGAAALCGNAMGEGGGRLATDKVAAPQLPHLLGALRAHLLCRAIDGEWLRGTHAAWVASLGAVMHSAQTARLAAGSEAGGETTVEVEGERAVTGTVEAKEGGAGSGHAQGGAALSGAGPVLVVDAASSSSDGSGSGSGGLLTALGGASADGSARDGGHRPAVVERRHIEALLASAADWCTRRGCVTMGSTSLLRQVWCISTGAW